MIKKIDDVSVMYYDLQYINVAYVYSNQCYFHVEFDLRYSVHIYVYIYL